MNNTKSVLVEKNNGVEITLVVIIYAVCFYSMLIYPELDGGVDALDMQENLNSFYGLQITFLLYSSKMLNRNPAVQVSDTTDDASSNAACYKIKKPRRIAGLSNKI